MESPLHCRQWKRMTRPLPRELSSQWGDGQWKVSKPTRCLWWRVSLPAFFLVCPLSDKKDSCETQFCHLKGVHLTPKIGHYLSLSVSVGPFHVPPNWLPIPLTAAGSSGEGSRGWVNSWALRAHSGPQWTLRGTGHVSALELLEDTDPWPLSLASEVPRASCQ